MVRFAGAKSARGRAGAPISYAERTHESPHWLVRHAHRRRFEAIISLALASDPEVVLDYGAGEGHILLAMLSDPRCPPSLRAVAYEPEPEPMARHLTRLADRGPVERIEIAAKLAEIEDRSCDVVLCAGVLEHLIMADRFEFYDCARRVLKPGGRVIVDSPVEIGMTLLIKNLGRRVLKGDRREYSFKESLSAAIGHTAFDPNRFDPNAGAQYILTHKGFDHRLQLKEMEAQGFHLERTVCTPLPWLPAGLANQEVIFVLSG